MTRKYDLYITYPTRFIKPDSKLFQIAETTVDKLKLAIDRIMNNKISIVWKGNTDASTSYRDIIRTSRLIVFFTHPEFDTDEEYTRELEEISEVMLTEKEDLTEGYSKVFRISLEPSKKALSPSCLDELLSYNFFEKNIYNRKIRSLDFNAADRTSVLYGRLLDLAYDISSSLGSDKTGPDSKSGQQRFVFLGLTTFDQQQARDEIKRELQHYGFRVLPFTRLPNTGEEFEKALISNLNSSDIVIQLMGSQYGDVLKGTKYSLVDFQNRIIREYQQKKEPAYVNRYIWIPQNMKISDQRQVLYLKRLRRDDATMNTEIIESPLETFKTILSVKLNSANHGIKNVEYENISRIYLLVEERNLQEVEDLYSVLALSGIKVVVLDFEEQVGIYARHLQALRDSDAVVVFQTSENRFWLNSKLRDIIKSPGVGRIKPFKKVVIASKLVPDNDLIRMIKTRVEVLDYNTVEPELILHKLISE